MLISTGGPSGGCSSAARSSAEVSRFEGLTISYYRRRTGQADTLMQMGRWFGFRKEVPGPRPSVHRPPVAGGAEDHRSLRGVRARIMYTEELFPRRVAEIRRTGRLASHRSRRRRFQPLVYPAPPVASTDRARNKMFNAQFGREKTAGDRARRLPDDLCRDSAEPTIAILPLMQQANRAGRVRGPGTDPARLVSGTVRPCGTRRPANGTRTTQVVGSDSLRARPRLPA